MVSFHSLTLSSFSVLFTPPLWKALSKTTAHLLFMHVHDPARVQKKKPLCLCYVTVSEGSRRSVFWYANERKYANERPHLDVNYSVAAIRISLMRHKVEEWKIGCLCKFEKIHLKMRWINAARIPHTYTRWLLLTHQNMSANVKPHFETSTLKADLFLSLGRLISANKPFFGDLF